MPREIMRKKAGDNVYLHRDFHGALSVGLDYLHDHYGEAAVRDYLRQFTLAFYAPLRDDLKKRGLPALKDHYERIYRLEGAAFRFRESADELVLEVEASPAVMHMREKGYTVARTFVETIRTVNEALCEGTPYAAELASYEPQTGRSSQRFYRRTT
ncbi:MAG: hypothetical protein HY343_10405 [Lentisphaerae bacterium]|nr:hypothetical protein [Lentisphaerota bacterium]